MDAKDTTPGTGESPPIESHAKQTASPDTVVEDATPGTKKADCGSISVGSSLTRLSSGFDNMQIGVEGWHSTAEKKESEQEIARQGVQLKIESGNGAGNPEGVMLLVNLDADETQALINKLEDAAALARGELDPQEEQ